jgi:uncharacterized lipoprotein YmbA
MRLARYVCSPNYLLLLVILMLLSGCAGTPETRFYLLNPLPMGSTQERPVRELALGIGPVKLPEYLDRPQIVIENDGPQIQLAEFEQWAEPLDENITRVLASNLGTLLATRQVSRYPWPPGTPVDYRITVDIRRFEAHANGRVQLEASWSISRSLGDAALLERTTQLNEAVTATGMEAVVAAQSRVLNRFSQVLADAVKGVAKRR